MSNVARASANKSCRDPPARPASTSKYRLSHETKTILWPCPATPLGPASVDGKADRARDPPHILTVFLLPWFIHGLFDFSLMVGPALEPHLTKPQFDMVVKAGVAVAVLVVGASAAIAIWFVGDLAYFSTEEHPREDAAEWPSIEAFEQGVGCASGREKEEKDVPVWR